MEHQPQAAVLEQTAKAIAIGAGQLRPDDPFAWLSLEAQRDFRDRARMALGGRSWKDAELFARDYAAMEGYGKTFNRLALQDQADVMVTASCYVLAVRLYLEGDVQALTPTLRAMMTPAEMGGAA
jgi:hypothetical protein